MNNSTRVQFRGLLRRQYKSKLILTEEEIFYIYIFTLIVGIIGNSLVVLSLMSRRRRRRMTANDVFILNLAVADLLLLLFFIPYNLYIRMAPFRPTLFVCKFTAPIITIALGGMVYTLTAMAVQRCLVITRPFSPECSVKRAALIVAFIWIISIAISIPKIVVATPFPQRRMCISKWKTQQHNTKYTVSLFVLRFAIPFFIIIISYIKMAASLLKTQAPRFATDSSGNIRDVTNRRENMEVVKTLIVISVLFFILLLPFRVTRLIVIFGQKDDILRNIYQLTATLTIAHSCVNPIIYGTFMKNFRKDYKRFFVHLFCCRLCRKSNEEEVTTQERFELDEACTTSENWRKPLPSNRTLSETTDSAAKPKSNENSCLLNSKKVKI